MPPRVAKKTPPGTKRETRAIRGTPKSQTRAIHGTPKSQTRAEVAKETVKVEDVKSETEAVEKPQPQAQAKPEPEVKEKQVPEPEYEPEMEANPEPGSKVKPEANAEENCAQTPKKKDEVKESVDEYEKDERLVLEDNEPDYGPEEYVGVDIDEKEIEQEDVHEEGDKVGEEGEGDVEEEEAEGDVVEEEEADMVDEEVEDEPQELVGGEYEEHGTEDHGRLVDSEEEERHEVVKERRKRKEFEVFVGGLDKDATEDDLKKVFSQVGQVTEVRLMMNSQTMKNKGFAFLRFATIGQAKRACAELKNPVVNGKKCGVTPSQDNDTLFLGNICKTWTKETLKEKLKHYGVENIEDLTLVEESNNEGTNRGFAFLEFSSWSDAMDAFKRLQRRDVVFGVDRPAKVSFADSIVDPGDEIMAQVKTVFVDGLPPSWDEDQVLKLLKKYGEIKKIELARNMPSARRKDFGFITFDTHDAAVMCARCINNEELGEGNSKAKVRARLSRPLQKGRGKLVGRWDFRSSRGATLGGRGPWVRPLPRSFPVHASRSTRGRMPPIDRGLKRPAGFRDRRSVMAIPPRSRPLPPFSRSYDRRLPVPLHAESSLRRDYGLREEVAMRSRTTADYGSRGTSDRRAKYRDDYSSHGSGFPRMPRDGSRTTARTPYVDDGYSQRFERPAPSYHDGRVHDYDNISGSKRPYAALDDVPTRYSEDDVPPHYSETGVHQSRARLDYELSGSGSQYRDAYSDRFGRSNLSYGGSRSSIGGQDSNGLYSSSRHGMGYGGGSCGGRDIARIYSSGFGDEYMSRGGDVGGSSYSSIYSSRGLDGSSYMESGGSGGYY